METLTLTQIFGLIGFVGYMAGFASQQLSIIDGDGKAYSVINIVSATLVLISLTEQFNLASALIQVSWIAIGSIGLLLRLLRPKIASTASRKL